MPELPEVETVTHALKQECEGLAIESVLCRRLNLRYPLPAGFADKLKNRRIIKVRRRAKYVLCDLDDGNTLILHLGMSGRVLIHTKLPQEYHAHDHIIMTFETGKTLVFNDARRFGMVDLCLTKTLRKYKFLKALGPEPFSPDFSGEALYATLRKRKNSIKAALMDQRVVAGLGNIYVCEALFRSGIAPQKAASAISREKAQKLVRDIRKVLQEAIQSGGSTLRDYVRSNGDAGYFQHHFQVYGREGEPCFVCGTPIKRMVQQGRSTFYCARCQK